MLCDNRNGTYIWVSVCGKHELYTIYGISQAVFDMNNDRHKLGSWRGGLKRGAGGLRFRSGSCALSRSNKLRKGTENVLTFTDGTCSHGVSRVSQLP